MVVIKYKNINTEIRSKLYGRNKLYTNYYNNKNNDVNLLFTDIDTKFNLPTKRGYRGIYSYGLGVFNRDLLQGAPLKYTTPEQARIAHNQQSLNHYYNKNADYLKDIDRSISFIKNIKSDGEILTDFYATHYEFNYFDTLTYDSNYKLKNKEQAYTVEDYKEFIKQDYVTKQNDLTLNQFQRLVYNYLKNLKRDDKLIYDYYFLTFERNANQHWHCHIAFYIPLHYSEKNIYWHNWLNKSWKHGISKALKIKSRNHKENKDKVLSYIGKDLNDLESDIIRWDSNIDRHSNRLVSQSDLTENLEDNLTTLKHPETLEKLRRYGIRRAV